MITDTLSRIFTSRPVKLVLVLFVLLALASQAVPQLVDSKPYVEKLAATIRTQSGGVLLVKGGSQLQVLPRPALVLSSAEIAQPHVPHSPSVTAEVAEFDIDILSLITGAPRVGAVRAAGVSLVAEQLPTGGANWGFLGVPLLKSLSALKAEHPVQVEIISGRVTVGDAKTGATYGISQLQASGEIGAESRMYGSLVYQDTPVQFSLTRSGTVGATPVTASLSSGSTVVSLKGNMDFTGEAAVVTGKLDITAADISQYLAVPDAGKPAAAIPFKLAADYAQKPGLVALANIALDTLNSQAAGSFEWDTAKLKNYKLSLNFSTLDLTGSRQLVAAYLASVNAPQDTHVPRTLVDKSLTMGLDITADKITNGSQHWNKAGFDGTLADGVLTVNKLSFALPGDSTLALFGLVSVSDTQGLRFEGNAEAGGSSLRDLLTVFDESASNLPTLGFGAYSLRSNLFISKELLRLSEADVKFSELALKGGLVAYFDKKTRIEADVALRDINFDYFRDSWRATTLQADKPGKDEFFLRFDRDMNFDWLKKLTPSIDFTVSVQGFTFLERKGKSASFRLFAQGGELGVYNAKFIYDNDTTEANLKFDVNGEQPTINLVLNTSTLNTAYFALRPPPLEPVKPAVSEESQAKEALPDMVMPDATPEEELRQKIAEEASQMQGAGGVPENQPATSAAASPPDVVTPEVTLEAAPETEPEAMPQEGTLPEGTEMPGDAEDPGAPELDMKPLLPDQGAWNRLRSLFIREAFAQEVVAPLAAPAVIPAVASPAIVPENETAERWSQIPIDMSLMEGIGGTFDISVGTLTHKQLAFQNFKMLAKLERNLLTFQTLTFSYWGGSFSINGTLFGGKVPGLSLGFIIASVDIRKMLEALLHIDTIGGRASISGTVDTSGINMLSWVSQATAKLLVAGRGVSIRGFDMAGVLGAVQASRTAADVLNSVNMSVVGGTGDYSADGAINLSRGVVSSPGIALKTGRVVGSVGGDFRLIPWDINLSGSFKFPELSTENVPSMAVRWSGPVEKPQLQTDTQALEAFVSKRITGN